VEIVSTQCVPVKDTTQIGQRLIGHHLTVVIRDRIKQPGNIAPPNFDDRGIAKAWVAVME
jgi:hypothetical protein